jgi:hypothetical protein
MSQPRLKNTNKGKTDQGDELKYLYHDQHGYELISGKGRLYLSGQAVLLGFLMNGKRSREEIMQKFENRYGLKLTNKDFGRFVRALRKYGFLEDREGDYLTSKLRWSIMEEQKKRFQKKRIREPYFAGSWYKDNPEELAKDLGICFASVDRCKLGIHGKRMERLKGIIVPHSNIELSGSCAAWAYQAVAERLLPDLVVLLAPDHFRFIKYPFSILAKDFRTPLGLVKVDRDIIKMLGEKCNFNIFAYNTIHMVEHSIEIQLLFLQYLYRNDMKRLRIIPILCGQEPLSSTTINNHREQFLQLLQKIILKSGRKVVFIASGDLIHSDGWRPTPHFHKKNKEMIHLLEEGDAEDFRRRLKFGRYRSCGIMPFYVFLRLLAPTRGKVLNYSWTNKPNPFNRNVRFSKYERLVNIGYASIAFY